MLVSLYLGAALSIKQTAPAESNLHPPPTPLTIAQPPSLNWLAYARSLPLKRTACPYFCSLVMSWSPWRTTSWYCLFLSSGRLVSMTPWPATRSMVQGMRPAAMNLARSLKKKTQRS